MTIIGQCNAITLNAVSYVYDLEENVYTYLTDKFNQYAKKNNLDVELIMTTYTIDNCTILVEDYGSILEHLLKKQSTKYDIIMYDNMYSPRFSPYFEDLRDWLPKEHIEMYASGVASQTCTFGEKWVGLPVNVDYSIFYSNMELLEKYNKTIPKTWDDVLITGKYILEKEKEIGNTDLMGYNGLYIKSETFMCSIYEYFYSYRETIDSPYPSYSSQEVIDALNKLKEIKRELASDEAFQMSEADTALRLFSGNGLFLKFFNIKGIHPVWKKTILPGGKLGISGTTVAMLNVGINKYITEEKKKKAAEIIEFMTSKESQKQYVIIDYQSTSGLKDLYYDEDVCKVEDCELIRSVQAIGRPSSLTDDYDKYSLEMREYLYEFLFDDESTTESPDAVETLQRIMDIVQINQIYLNPSVSPEGFVIFIVTVILGIIMLFSLIFLFTNERYKNEMFRFFSLDSWIIIFIGFFFGLSSIYTDYGEATELKCQSKGILLSVGYTFIIIPILHQLIANFQIPFKNIIWIRENKYFILVMAIAIDIFVNELIFLSKSYIPYEIEIKKGKNFEVCKMVNTFGIALYSILAIEKILITLSVLLFLYMEWNLPKTKLNIKIITSNLYVNILLMVIIFIVCNINIKSYVFYFLLRSTIVIIYVFSNYIFIFLLRLIIFDTKEIKKTIIQSSNIITKSSIYCRNAVIDDDSKSSKSSIVKSITDIHKNESSCKQPNNLRNSRVISTIQRSSYDSLTSNSLRNSLIILPSSQRNSLDSLSKTNDNHRLSNSNLRNSRILSLTAQRNSFDSLSKPDGIHRLSNNNLRKSCIVLSTTKGNSLDSLSKPESNHRSSNNNLRKSCILSNTLEALSKSEGKLSNSNLENSSITSLTAQRNSPEALSKPEGNCGLSKSNLRNSLGTLPEDN